MTERDDRRDDRIPLGKHLKVDAFSPHRHSIDANDRLVEILTSARRRVGLVGEDGNGQ